MRKGARHLVIAAAMVAAMGGAANAADKATPKGTTPDGSTPLMQAAYDGDVAQARRLLAQHANVNAVNAYGVSAMLLAAESSNTALIDVLLKAGAKANSANLDGETALHLVARTGNVAAARLLLAHGVKVDAREKFGGQTPLMWAAARRHAPMVEFLASKGADVNARSMVRDYQRVATAESRAKFLDRGGFTPLLYAVRENCKDCVDILLKHKADINLPDPANVPPLSIAMMNGNWDVARRLVEAGADVNAWDIFGQSPLHVAIGYMNTRAGNNPLDSDAQNKATGRDLVKLLVDRGANPNQELFFKAPGRDTGVGRGYTPFLAACASGDLDLVKLLLEHGANPKLATADGQGAIILAVGSRVGGTANPGAASASGADFGNAQGVTTIRAATGPEDRAITLIKFLAANGADVKLVAKRHFLQRTRGGSALHYAVRGGNKALIGALLDLGADVNAKDEDGLTALDYAMGRGYVPFLQLAKAPNKDLADVLRARGATVELDKTPDWPPQGAPIGVAVFDAVIWPVDPVGG
ncbi:MAG: ankyrin repeat domain-containing protein [Caulobacteraceae bacterium]